MIFNSNNKKAKAPVTPPPLSEIQKKEVSIRLKSVEKLIKDGRLDEAIVKLETVRSMDPKNGYILALEERIEELRKTRENAQSVESPKAGDDSSEKKETERRVETGYLEQLTEEIHKTGEKLEAEYRDKLMEEINKSEARTAEMLKEERERHDAETATLIEAFDKEKEKMMKDLKKETRKLFDFEFKRAEDSYKKLLADKLGVAEEETRVEISALFEKAIVELKEAVARDRNQILDVERKTLIEETRKRTQDELQKRFMAEIAKIKTALAPNAEEHGEEERVGVRTDAEEKSEEDLKLDEEQIEAKLREIKKASEERLRRSIQEGREASTARIPEVKKNDPKSKTEIESKLEKSNDERYKRSVQEAPDTSLPQVKPNDSKSKMEIESKPAEVSKDGTDLGIKSEEQLAKERELRDKQREMEFKDILNGVNWKDRPRKKKG